MIREMALCLVLIPGNSFADGVFRCRMSAKASRDFSYQDNAWCGPVEKCGKEAGFGLVYFPKPNFAHISYRELLLAFDDSKDFVSIKAFWGNSEDGKPLSEEFRARLIGEDGDVVFFLAVGQFGNKVHSYALNRARKRLVISSVINGVTSLGAEARTFDCE